MNQYDTRHYKFPRTSREAFGTFMPMRSNITFKCGQACSLLSLVAVVAVLVIAALLN